MLKSFAEEEKARGNTAGGGLDLFSDPEMEQFFTRGIRGGQSFISQRYAIGEKNPENAGNHLLYVDGKSFKNQFSYCSVEKNNVFFF